MKIGKLIYWNSTYGFIETRVPEPIGIKIERYFLHSSQIVLEPSIIHEGQIVRFLVRERQPEPGKLPYAGSAEIFETPERLQAAEKGGQGGAL
jgi:hypothetical protein